MSTQVALAAYKYIKSLCTAYKSTVQTDQAMITYIHGAGPKGNRIQIPVGQYSILFYRYFFIYLQNSIAQDKKMQCHRAIKQNILDKVRN